MLSKNAKTVLKLARKTSNQKISYGDLLEALQWDYERIHSACNQLIDRGYAKEKPGLNIPGRPNLTHPWGIILKEEGRQPWRYTLEKICTFMVKSIFVPIIVSIITTLVTLLISELLQS